MYYYIDFNMINIIIETINNNNIIIIISNLPLLLGSWLRPVPSRLICSTVCPEKTKI